ISTASMYFYVGNDSPLEINSIEEARELPEIAVMKDYAEYSILKEKNFDNLVQYEDMDKVITKLVKGEIPVFVITNLIMNTKLEELDIAKPAVKKSMLLSAEFEYIAFSKSTPDRIIDLWQKHLNEMKRDGTFGTIFKKWLPKETPPGILQIFTEDYPPLSFKKDGEITGYGTEVVHEILAKLSIPDNIRMASWDNAYNMALVNPNFVLYTMKKTPKREDLFYWVGPIGSNRTFFYAKKGSGIKINSLEDAKKVDKIATCSSWFSEQMLKDEGFTNLVSSPSPAKNVKQLAEGKVELSIFTDITLPMIAQEAGYSINDFKPVYIVSKGDFYITLSKDTSEDIVDDWKETFKEIYNDGTLQKIMKKWLPNSELSKI
ncbi:MAG: transporter substrate-binding domain-containing protein, partial [Candidatus Cloacimonetes bacterium]|nr:transporter substrate-binding domain-containing protein [Candidatus Cloacimonadota bacterium]